MYKNFNILNMKKVIRIALIAVLILVVFIVYIYMANVKNNSINKDLDMENLTNNELKITVLKEGDGKIAKNNDKIKVHYTGWLVDGTKFDSSLDRGEAFEFVLGIGQVIQGWDQGVLGMKEGEIRRLEIPSQMAYGERDLGTIPANSDLNFEVQLLEVVE